MKVTVLGDKGSIGSRHLKNLQALGVETASYDPISGPPELRQNAISASDAIVIATPTPQHLRDLSDAILAGKHVFVEKPISNISSKIRELLDRAAERSLVVAVGNNLRFHACVKAAKGNLLNGAIGKPLWTSITVGQFTSKEPYLRDGVTLNWGSHEIDLALYLLGPAKVLCASTDSSSMFRPGTADSNVNVIGMTDEVMSDFVLKHDSGCRSTLHCDYVTNPEIRATTIVGDKGQMVIDLVARWLCITTTDGKRHEFQATDSWDSNYLDEMKGFLARVNGFNDGIGATGEDGLATLKIIEAVKEKAKS